MSEQLQGSYESAKQLLRNVVLRSPTGKIQCQIFINTSYISHVGEIKRHTVLVFVLLIENKALVCVDTARVVVVPFNNPDRDPSKADAFAIMVLSIFSLDGRLSSIGYTFA